jgi:hypothetical protein
MPTDNALGWGAISMPRLCILVCGTHRCGTSAVTRVINLLGADIARDLIPAKPDNIRGFWESSAITAIHDDLLNAMGSEADPFDPVSLPVGWQDTKQAERAKFRLIDHVESEFSDSRLFVVKDPRISRLIPLWLDVLQTRAIDVIVVIPFRNPLEVAASLAQRDGLSLPKGLLLYLQSYLDVEFISRARRRIFIRYDSLLDDWRTFQTQLAERSDARLAAPSSITVAEIDKFLTADLYHHRFSRKELFGHADVPMIMVELYDNLCKAVDIEYDLSVRAAFDRLRTHCQDVDRLYRGFINAERRAMRNALKEEFERSTSWRVTAPLRRIKLMATNGFRSNPSTVFRKLMVPRDHDYGRPPTIRFSR